MQFFPHQLEGIDFLTMPTPAGKQNKLLAWAPGTGKTATACGAFKKVGAKNGLITCLSSSKHNWARNLVQWGVCEPEQIVIISKRDQGLPTGDWFFIVNYELLYSDTLYRQLMHGGKFDAIAIDEPQVLKSISSKISKRVLGGGDGCALASNAKWRWPLSGTIMPNRPMELYPLLASMAREVLDPYISYESYGKRYCNGWQDADGWHFEGASNVEELRERLKAFMDYRPLAEVWEEIPDVVERTLYIDIGDLPSGADETNTEMGTLRKEIGIAKIPYMLEHLNDRLKASPREKLLVYTYHRDVSEALHRAIPTSRLMYGGINAGAKAKALSDFVNDPHANPLIAQQTSVGTAIDGIQKVCFNVVDCEPEWSPGKYDQQLGRVQRIGQKSGTIFRTSLIAQGTYDERVIMSRRTKQRTVDKLFRKNVITTKEGLEMADKELERIAIAVETLVLAVTAVGKGQAAQAAVQATVTTNGKSSATTEKAAKAPTSTSAKDAENESIVSVEDIKNAAIAFLQESGETDENRSMLQGICKKHGSKTSTADGVPEKKRALVLADIQALSEESDEAERALAATGI